MPLNPVRGNMYPWVTHTFTCLVGECPHRCAYCYTDDLRRHPALAERYGGPPRLVESDLRLGLGQGKTVFVASTGDLFAQAIPAELIERVLLHCCLYPDNRYLFQTKNPRRFWEFADAFPPRVMLGTTIESNRDYPISCAPPVLERAGWLTPVLPFPRMVSVEPIMDFDVHVLTRRIQSIGPEFVSVGADSKRHSLPEPPGEKVRALVAALEEFTEVRQKSNLSRLLRGGKDAT